MSRVEGALRSSAREGFVGFVPTTSKLYPPSPGSVPRAALVERVRSGGADVVTVSAPAGYGKSTFLAELIAPDPRPVGWLSLTGGEDDPAALLTYIALAIDDIEPVDPRCVTALWARSPTVGTAAFRQFGAMIADRRRPFVLVLDDVHELTSRDVLDILPALVAEMPPGSTIVLCGRTAVPLPLGRLRVRRRLVEVGPVELAFDALDAAILLADLGLDVSADETARLVERTEGWPVAVYLAALAHRARRGPMADLVGGFAGDHRFVVEYLGDELLAELDADVARFLMEASCLERLSGGLCDDVLRRTGSADLLEDLRRRNLLVIPLDDRREWYRFHQLMAEFLQAELARRDPERRTAVHLRASDWCDRHGDADGAVEHAVAGGDLERAESMVLRWFGTTATAGRRYPVSERWIALFPVDELGRRPLLMVVAAWARFAGGAPGPAAEWLARAVAGMPDRHPEDAEGLVGPVALALARAIIAPLSTVEMATEATYVYDHVGRGEGHPMSCLARGAAAFMLGDEAEAATRLREGAETTLDRPLAVANCLAHLAVIDVEHGRWAEATTAARRAKALLGDAGGFASAVLVLAVNVLVETHAGGGDEIATDRELCRSHLAGLLGVAPWLNLQARLVLARAAHIRDNRIEAEALLAEVDAILEAVPDAVGVEQQLRAIRRAVPARDTSSGYGPSSLTTAELRVLQLLPTHLSVREIADRLYVSRNTVKSQTIAIYRKLGTSSRRGAIEIAVVAGLLADAVPPL